MTVRGEVRSLGLLATALARAEAWLLEPPEPASAVVVPEPPRPIVTVRGLAPRCGASTVARGLAAVLAMAGPPGAAGGVGPPGRAPPQPWAPPPPPPGPPGGAP